MDSDQRQLMDLLKTMDQWLADTARAVWYIGGARRYLDHGARYVESLPRQRSEHSNWGYGYLPPNSFDKSTRVILAFLADEQQRRRPGPIENLAEVVKFLIDRKGNGSLKTNELERLPKQKDLLGLWTRAESLCGKIERQIVDRLVEQGSPPPLSEAARKVREILLAVELGRGLTGNKIIAELAQLHQLRIEQSTLTSRIIPALKDHYGLENLRGTGYFIPEHRRPKDDDIK